MLTINDLKPGIVFLWQGELFEVIEAQHLHLGRGGAVLQTKIKNLKRGSYLLQNFKTSQTFKEIEILREKAKFIYSHRGKFWFCSFQNPKERFFLKEEKIGQAKDFLKPSLEIEVIKSENQVLNISLPPTVDLKVIEAPPDFRGDTEGGGKIVKLETGVKIKVPFFIQEEDIIQVNTRSFEYIKRIKKAK